MCTNVEFILALTELSKELDVVGAHVYCLYTNDSEKKTSNQEQQVRSLFIHTNDRR